MPPVRAVTGLLLRRQNRRQMSVLNVAGLCSRLPRLESITFEAWAQLERKRQPQMYHDTAGMLRSLQTPNSQLRRMSVHFGARTLCCPRYQQDSSPCN
ncbi:hypothetical protein QBC46DRAFT_63308 [Diplogelasinospora grovesii]|uniref:Uncharacterized protein n=1 Tax=Diplogelasinospora grovesii TaxID=303347 RepID=A0AAN6S9E8_9PEZI|nr:hypothetical protein QBC46DRAFT_63308 [Diplogelasinospora grovesii]